MSLFGFFAGVARGPDLMERMMNRFGVRRVLADKPHAAEVTRRAAIRCMACSDKDACTGWLNSGAEDEHVPQFCRNRDLIERLARELPPAAAA